MSEQSKLAGRNPAAHRATQVRVLPNRPLNFPLDVRTKINKYVVNAAIEFNPVPMRVVGLNASAYARAHLRCDTTETLLLSLPNVYRVLDWRCARALRTY